MMTMRSLLLCSCLVLLVSVASANLVEDQTSGLERVPSMSYDGHRLRCYQQGDVRIVQPPIAFQLSADSRVRRDPLGNGFYVLVPLHITQNIKLPTDTGKQYHVLNVRRFNVQLRDAPCPTKCPKVTVSAEWRREDSPVVRFRCDSRRACRRLLQSLRFNGERSRSLRASLKFTFYGTANGTQYALSRIGLPVDNAISRPFNEEFWFDFDKLVLFTIKAGIGLPAFETYQSQQSYPIPHDGSLPDVYRSHLVDKLETVASTGNWEIVAEMRKADRTVAQAVFSADPSGLNKDTWFSADRLISSKPFWAGHSGFNFFSVAGHGALGRRFFINKVYGGCPNDVGLFVVSDIRDPCQWGSQFFTKAPALIYSSYENIPYQSGSAQSADTFLIYFRHGRPSATSAPALPGAYNFEKGKVLLFTVEAGSNNAAADVFLNSDIKHAVPSGGLPALYRSELIDSLSTIYSRTKLRSIVAEMRSGDRMVSQIVFDISTRSSTINKENWFARDRVVSSHPISPIGDSFNFFSIRGDATWKRSFFVSYVYAGCSGDRAFWVVSDGRDPCTWGNRHFSGRSPTLVYSTSREITLDAGAAKTDANRFLIYLM